MRIHFSSFALSLLLVASVGCDKNGYPGIGERLDVVQQCGPNTTTWVRSTCGTHPNGEEGHLMTEVIVFGTDDLSPTATASGCFVRTELFHDTSGRQWAGSFDGVGGVANVIYGHRYTFDTQANLAVIQRRGSYRDPLDPVETVSYAYSSDGATLTLTDTATGEEATYYNVIDLLGSLDPTDPLEAVTFTRLISMSMFHLFQRLLGFGSGGMSQYTTPSEFSALLTGTVRVKLTDILTEPRTYLSYSDAEEFTGFVLAGQYVNVTDLGGNGHSYDTLNFDLRNDIADPTSRLSGRIEFTDVDVINGFGATGCYDIHVGDNAPVIVPGELFNTIDLSAILPTDGNPPGSGATCPMYDPWPYGPSDPEWPSQCPRD